MTTDAVRMRDGPPVADLVTRAKGGDKQAWDALVERYIPLVWSICRRHQLNNADARDVSQTVWRQLASQLGAIRHPTALASWLATTTQRECDRIRRSTPHLRPIPQTANTPGEQTRTAERELRMAEHHAALREAFTDLPPHCQRLIAMLIQDPLVPDAEISARLGIPAPALRRHCHNCLQKLRRHPAIATLTRAEASTRGSQTSGQAVASLRQPPGPAFAAIP